MARRKGSKKPKSEAAAQQASMSSYKVAAATKLQSILDDTYEASIKKAIADLKKSADLKKEPNVEPKEEPEGEQVHYFRLVGEPQNWYIEKSSDEKQAHEYVNELGKMRILSTQYDYAPEQEREIHERCMEMIRVSEISLDTAKSETGKESKVIDVTLHNLNLKKEKKMLSSHHGNHHRWSKTKRDIEIKIKEGKLKRKTPPVKYNNNYSSGFSSRGGSTGFRGRGGLGRGGSSFGGSRGGSSGSGFSSGGGRGSFRGRGRGRGFS